MTFSKEYNVMTSCHMHSDGEIQIQGLLLLLITDLNDIPDTLWGPDL